MNIDRETIPLGSPGMNGVNCSVRSANSKNYKNMTLQKFVYECYHDLVPARKVIKQFLCAMNVSGRKA